MSEDKQKFLKKYIGINNCKMIVVMMTKFQFILACLQVHTL